MPDPIILVSGLIGALVSAILNIVFNAWSAHRKIVSARALLREEILLCGDTAQTFATAGYYSPLYRLPTAGFSASLRELIGAGEIGSTDAKALIEFYGQVETLNRGLDLAADTLPESLKHDVQTGELGETQKRYHSRNLIKAEDIRAPAGHLYVKALSALERRPAPFVPRRISARPS